MDTLINLLTDILSNGLPYALLALGVFISYRVLDFADLTCESCFVFGGAIAIVLIKLGCPAYIATIMSLFGGSLCGFVTGILHTKLKIPGLLAGIITLTGFVTINMFVLGMALIPDGGHLTFSKMYNSVARLTMNNGDQTIFGVIYNNFDIDRKYAAIIIMAIIVVLFFVLTYFFFGTEIGMSIRATGMNPKMARAQGINTNFMIVLGLIFSNALVALGGALYAQYKQSISIPDSQGIIVIGLASIIMGEAIGGKKSFARWLLSVLIGAFAYYFVIAITPVIGLPDYFTKFIIALIVVLVLVAPLIKTKFLKWYNSPMRIEAKNQAINMKIEKLSMKPNGEELVKCYKDKLILMAENRKRIAENRKNIMLEKEKMKDASYREQKSYDAHIEKLSNKPNADALISQYKIDYQSKQTLEAERIKQKQQKSEDLYELYLEKRNKALIEKNNKKQEFKQKFMNGDKTSLDMVSNDEMLHIEKMRKVFNPTGNVDDIKVALDDVSINIKKGEFVTIIGGNGSGKSTFINTVSGTYIPEAGKIYIDGVNVTNMPEYKRSYYVGKVAQDPYQGTAQNMSILENMSLAIRRDKTKTLAWGFNREDTAMFEQRVSTLGLGLETRMTSKIGLLSGGQRQAVTLLMATLEKPEVLFLDEHTAALDPKTAKTVLDLTDKIVRENNLTAIMVTHNMKDAIKYGDRLLMFNNGHIIYDVSGEEKKNLTVEQLLKKFENKVEFSDKDILA